MKRFRTQIWFAVTLALVMSAVFVLAAQAADVIWYEEDFAPDSSTTNGWESTGGLDWGQVTDGFGNGVGGNDGAGGDGNNGDGAIAHQNLVAAGTTIYRELGVLDSQATNITVDANLFHRNVNGNFNMVFDLYNVDADRVVASTTENLPNGWYPAVVNTNVTLTYAPIFEERGDTFQVRLTTQTVDREAALDYIKAEYSTGTITTDDSIWYEAAFTKSSATNDWTALDDAPVLYDRGVNDGDGGDGVNRDGSLYVIPNGGNDGGYYTLGALDAEVTNLTVSANIFHQALNILDIYVELYNATDAAVVASTSAQPEKGWYDDPATTFEDVSFSYEPVPGDAGKSFQVRFWGATIVGQRYPALDYIRVHAYKPTTTFEGTLFLFR